MKKFSYYFVLVFSVLALSVDFFLSCDDKDNKNDGDTNKYESNVDVYSSIYDNRIVSVEKDDGTSLCIYGEKNENGILENVTQMVVANEKGEETTISMNEGRPSVFYLPNGVIFKFEWDSNTSAAISIFDSSGENSFHTYIDFLQDNNLKRSIGKTNVVRKSTDKTRIGFADIHNDIMMSPNLKNSSQTENTCHLYVYNCDQPYNTVSSDVNVIMRNEFGSLITILPTKRVGNGDYLVTIPDEFVPNAINIKPLELQKQLVELLNVVAGKICDTYTLATGGGGGVIQGTQLCVAVSSALVASGIGVTVVPEFFAACESVIIALDLSCGLYQIIGKDLYDGLANLFDYNFNINEGYLLIPKVQGIPYSIIGEKMYVGPSSPLSDMYMSVNGETSIRNFSLIPSNPSAGVSYQAVADIYCIRSGSSVEMSIVGTDGYSDTQRDYFLDGIVEQRCILWVPGAESGIRDKCTIKVHCPDGTVLSQNATLVFN